jgi:hypothetical protein
VGLLSVFKPANAGFDARGVVENLSNSGTDIVEFGIVI